jgi:hypothetical protein
MRGSRPDKRRKSGVSLGEVVGYLGRSKLKGLRNYAIGTVISLRIPWISGAKNSILNFAIWLFAETWRVRLRV